MRCLAWPLILSMLTACSGAKDHPPEAVTPPPVPTPTATTPPPPPPPTGPGGSTPDGRALPPRLGAIPTDGSLCQGGEEVIFSCAISESRIVSLCGDLAGDPGWLQLRLGRLDALEVRWPPGPEQSIEAFTYGVYTRAQVTMQGAEVSTGRTRYEVYDDDVEGTVAAGVRVTMPSGTVTDLPCEGARRGDLLRLRDRLEPVPLWR